MQTDAEGKVYLVLGGVSGEGDLSFAISASGGIQDRGGNPLDPNASSGKAPVIAVDTIGITGAISAISRSPVASNTAEFALVFDGAPQQDLPAADLEW